MTQPAQYTIRDNFGNLYGPASIELLRQWIREGRIVAGMLIAPEGTTQWMEVSSHLGLADLFGKPALSYAQPMPAPAPVPAVSTTPATPTTPVELVYHHSTARVHLLSIVSLITGILGFFTCCCMVLYPVGALLGMAAVITGIIALREIKARPDEYTGTPLAIIGIICGSIELLIQLLLWGSFLINFLVHMKF